MSDHWQSRMWQGLMHWVEDEQHVERRHVEETHAQRNIQALLAAGALDDLAVDDFNRTVWRHGHLERGDDERDLSEVSLDEMQARLDSGEWQVEGNRTVGQATNTWGIQLKVGEDEKPELLRSALRLLLYSEGDIHDRVEEVDADTNGLGRNAITLILCMMRTDELGIMNQKSESGLRKLAWLLGAEDEWEERIAGDYRVFNELLQEVRDNSGGVLRDMLMVDAFLYGLSELPEEPQHWKVAVAPFRAEHAELIRLFFDGEFAAVSSDPEKINVEGWVERLQRVNPGDYVVLHSHTNAEGVGRVTRPYYQVGATDADGLSAEYCHRVGVDWLPGTRQDNVGVFRGARETNTVVVLEPDHFWALAVKYADDPRFEEVLNPPEDWPALAGLAGEARAWIFQANPDRWDFFGAMRRPMPYTEDWAVNQRRDETRVGDRVYLWPSGPKAGIHALATISTEPYETPDDEFGKWKVDLTVERVLDEPLLRTDLREDARTADLLVIRQPQGTNFPLTAEEAAAIEEMLGGRGGPTLEVTAGTCCCEPAFVEEIVAQLQRKGQVILYGPPGTGKTYVARRIAEYLTEGDDSRRELIQFHPSYSYEDFMEGIKPESRQCADDRWEVSYPVRAGSFMRFCERARDDEDGDRKYVFIIDEINRGQIAKVFGELMYLLEYRDDDIQLAYTKSEADDSRQRFSIPANVLIMGTMNTADRSIALVDFALRRRFTFIPFFPDDRADGGHVQGMLRRWLIREGKDQQAWVAEMLDALNRRLEPDVGRDFLIGHSYFMLEDLSEETVRETWRFQIEPLLREYFVGQQSRLDGYRLDELIAGAKGIEQPEGDAESDDADRGTEEPGDDEQ